MTTGTSTAAGVAAGKDPEEAKTYEEFLNRSNMSGDAQGKKEWLKKQREKKESATYGSNIYSE